MKKKRKEEAETMDIYKDEQREQMLKGDEITAAESALMAGRDRKIGKKKKDLWLEKKEAKPVELAQEEHQED
jgi:hypothetical protein